MEVACRLGGLRQSAKTEGGGAEGQVRKKRGLWAKVRPRAGPAARGRVLGMVFPGTPRVITGLQGPSKSGS